jgi:hypothetical protein
MSETAPWAAETDPQTGLCHGDPGDAPRPVWDAQGEHIIGHEGDRHLSPAPDAEAEPG